MTWSKVKVKVKVMEEHPNFEGHVMPNDDEYKKISPV